MLGLAWAQSPAAKAVAGSPSDAELRARLVAFLDRTIGYQQLDKIDVQSISAPDPSGLRTAKVMLEKGGQKQIGSFLITADGKEIVEGEKSTLSADPWAETRAHIDTRGAPAIGAADAPVTIVEFSDLECPFCRQEAQGIEQLMNEQPGKFRVVFKYFPLVEIHPWSMQAAEAAVCVAEQDPSQFWNFEKAVFAAQDQINPTNAAGRLRDFALESGAQPAPYAACLANPATKAKIEASISNGKSVGVVSTPTLFIDGRLIPGAIAEDQLKLLVDHESTFASGKIVGQQCGSCKVLPPIKH